MLRSTSAVLAILLSVSAHAAGAPECKAREPETRPRSGELMFIACDLPAAEAGPSYRLKITFEGSHDDTTIYLSAKLDGKEFACRHGSKTESEYEDGGVTMSCVLPRGEAKGAAFEATLKWYHAQYAGYAVAGE